MTPRVTWTARHGAIEPHWQLGPTPLDAGPWTLLRWQLAPEPVDGGMPPPAAQALADALTALGPVAFASSRGASIAGPDDTVQPLPAARLAARIASRLAGEPATLSLVWARRASTVIQAFDDAALPWSQQSQCLLLAATGLPLPAVGRDAMVALLDGGDRWQPHVPALRAAGVRAVLRPAVDGDAVGLLALDGQAGPGLLRRLGAESAPA